MVDELIEKLVEEKLKEFINQLEEQEELIEINLSQASKLVGRSRNTLSDVLYRNRKEIESVNGGFVIFPEGGPWRIAKRPFIEWWEGNLYKTV